MVLVIRSRVHLIHSRVPLASAPWAMRSGNVTTDFRCGGRRLRTGCNHTIGGYNQVVAATRRRSLWCTPSLRSNWRSVETEPEYSYRCTSSLRSNQESVEAEPLLPKSHRPDKCTVSRCDKRAGRVRRDAQRHGLTVSGLTLRDRPLRRRARGDRFSDALIAREGNSHRNRCWAVAMWALTVVGRTPSRNAAF